jgi:transposase
MLKGQLVFAQLTAHLPRSVFNDCVAQYAGRYPTLTFSYWDQFLSMVFAQLTTRTSLRDITTCLRSHSAKLYFASFRGSIARSTLADANERRDSRTFERFALHLIDVARSLYAKESLGLQLAQSVYAIDATTIDLCLGLFSWAPAANAHAGVKLNTVLDLRGNIPSVIRITSTLVSDASFLDHLRMEAGSFYVMDRGYLHFRRLAKFNDAAAFFVIRSKDKLLHTVISSNRLDAATGVLSDQRIALVGRYTRVHYPAQLRRIEFRDPERDRILIFLTNNFELQALQIAQLYKSRWQVELFFKWIKQHLRIKAFFGTSANALKTQIWTAVATYVLVAILKKRLGASASLHAILQVLSLNLFEKTPLDRLLGDAAACEEDDSPTPQLPLL